tara:strand:+ start:1640 stop:1825 length:186 start_codon:yes stop_codon:yes gene_type:complete
VTLNRATLWVILDKDGLPRGMVTDETGIKETLADLNAWDKLRAPHRHQLADVTWQGENDVL